VTTGVVFIFGGKAPPPARSDKEAAIHANEASGHRTPLQKTTR